MNKILNLLLFAAVFFASPLLSQKVIQGENAQVRSVPAFSAISVSGPVDVLISQGSETMVVVDAGEISMRDNITTQVVNGTLQINYKSNLINYNGRKWLKVYLSTPKIAKITASGSCNVKIEGGLTMEDLEILISGASDFNGSVVAENLKLTGSGSADFNISGKCTNLRIAVSGASDVKGTGLTSDYCDVVASGSSDVRISVTKEIKATASGASDIIFYGAAALRSQASSGASSIRRGNRTL